MMAFYNITKSLNLGTPYLFPERRCAVHTLPDFDRWAEAHPTLINISVFSVSSVAISIYYLLFTIYYFPR